MKHLKQAIPGLLLVGSLIILASDCDRDRESDCPDPYNPLCENYDSCLVYPEKCPDIKGPWGGISKNTIQIAWNSGSDLPFAVGWTAAVVMSNQVWVIGGTGVETGTTHRVQIYDPETDRWTDSGKSMNHARWGHTVNLLDGRIYVLGGCPPGIPSADNIIVANKTIEVYDPVEESWVESGEMTAGRIGHGSVVHQGKIYILGGEFQEPSLHTLSSMEVYDPATRSWEELADMPTPRIFMGTCLVGDTIYAIGGGSSYPYSGKTTIEAYLIKEDRWEERTGLKMGLGDVNTCVIDNKIICAGGWSMWSDDANSRVQVYDPAYDSVYMATDMQVARMAGAAVALNNKIYLFTGVRTIEPEFSVTPTLEIGIPEFW